MRRSAEFFAFSCCSPSLFCRDNARVCFIKSLLECVCGWFKVSLVTDSRRLPFGAESALLKNGPLRKFMSSGMFFPFCSFFWWFMLKRRISRDSLERRGDKCAWLFDTATWRSHFLSNVSHGRKKKPKCLHRRALLSLDFIVAIYQKIVSASHLS